MLNIVIFGAPGSGKGTQSKLIAKKHGLEHISTGHILRAEIKANTELGKIADEYISKGQLVPDELIIEVIEHILDNKKELKGIIFDGFPRTLMQGEALEKMLGRHNTEVHSVLSLDVEEEELINRLLERGKVSGRSDDNLETIQERLQVYHNQTSPLKSFYDEKGTLAGIKGTGSVDEIFGRVSDVLEIVNDINIGK
jgi:adenylate kinase